MIDHDRTTRRQWLKLAAAGLGVTAGSGSTAGWLQSLAADAVANPSRRRSVILLWMNGGPSQIDTFDPKPGTATGGPFQAIETATPGIRIGEHLPKVARWTQDMAIVRSMSTKEGDHGRATFLMRTGYLPGGPIAYPPLGALLSKELEMTEDELPGFVSVGPFRAFSAAAYSSGFLGPRFAPLIVGENQGFQPGNNASLDESLKVADLRNPRKFSLEREDARLGLLNGLAAPFQADHAESPATSQRMAYQRAVRLMRSKAVEAFDLTQEKDAIRDAYGRNPFGQGCLLARRLVEREVPFIEVTLSGVNTNQGIGWDTHAQNFDAVKGLCGVLDPAWATLMEDLKSRGLMQSTLIVWMGEFGRTPTINPQNGRDHFPNAWTVVLAGGGIKGGQAIGDTGVNGQTVKENPTSVADLFSTVCHGIGIDPMKQNMSDVGRPIRIVSPEAKPIKEALA